MRTFFVYKFCSPGHLRNIREIQLLLLIFGSMGWAQHLKYLDSKVWAIMENDVIPGVAINYIWRENIQILSRQWVFRNQVRSRAQNSRSSSARPSASPSTLVLAPRQCDPKGEPHVVPCFFHPTSNGLHY
jgi:hypothetical protein